MAVLVRPELQGGKFGHGFLSAGVTKFFSPGIQVGQTHAFTGTLTAAILGGTVSEITGGKFANGAATGAMAYAFNQLTSKGERSTRQQEAAVIYQRFNSYKRKNPGSPIPVDGEELSVILSVDATVLDRLYDWDADRSYWQYLKNLKSNDSHFLTSYGSDTFRVSGAGRLNGIYTGSTINYYYVGMTAAAQGGFRYSLPAYVEIWNVGQSVYRGWTQIQQIDPATDWAEAGYDFYVDGGWR